jgi:S-adenosylmethionine hydrolase
MTGIITLTTDFGFGHYVGQMKGVIATRCPGATVIDLTHDLEPQNLIQGAWVLQTSLPHFPPGTIHVVVVDPGVGGDRRALAVKTSRGVLIGPDNGVLWPAMSAGGPAGSWLARQITVSFREQTSRTFHGRDLFAPAAAHLAAGGDMTGFGPPVLDPVRLELPPVRRIKESLRGEVLFADRFGNLITNLDQVTSRAFLSGRRARVKIKDGPNLPLVETYAQVGPGEPCALFGSSGYLEIAVNQGHAGRHFSYQPSAGPAVSLKPER